MRSYLRLVRRLPVVSALAAALVISAGAYAALSVTDSADPTLEPPPSGQAPLVPAVDGPQARDIAAKAAAEAGQGVESGSVRQLVPPSTGTRGFSLWSWQTEEGNPAVMIVDPSGTPVIWTGCRRGSVAHVERCGAWGTPDGLLVLTGRSAPDVQAVQVAGPRLAATPAVLGNGGWLWVGTDFGPTTPVDRAPDVVIARTEDGTIHRAPVAID